MDLDARHRTLDRRRLEIVEADGGGADERQLACDPPWIDAALEQVLDRDETLRIVAAEVHPQLTMIVGRQHQAAKPHASHARGVGPDQDGARLRHDAQQLHRQRRHDRALRLHDQRHAAHDAVRLGRDRQHAASGRRRLQLRDVLHQPRTGPQERARIGAHHAEACRRRMRLGLRVRDVDHRLPDHDPRLSHGAGENLVVARQAQQFLPGLVIQVGKGARHQVRRQPIGFCENDVEGDCRGTEFGQAGDEVRHQGTRPGPLAERTQALLIDVEDDGRRARHQRTRRKFLIRVERPQPQLFQRQRVPNPQPDQREQQQHANAAPQPELPCQPADFFHVRAWALRRRRPRGKRGPMTRRCAKLQDWCS